MNRSYIVKVDQFVPLIPTANNINVWGSIALLIIIAYHRVQTTEYAPVLTYRQRFCVLPGTWDDLKYLHPMSHVS